MKRGDFYFFPSILYTVFMITVLLFSCSIEPGDEEIKSELIGGQLEELGKEVGVNWGSAQATNISTSISPRTWEGLEIADVKVIKNGTKYYMWYSGRGLGYVPPEPAVKAAATTTPPTIISVPQSSIWQIGFAESDDGINWKKDYVYNPVLFPGDSASPDKCGVRLVSVMYDDREKLYKVWYKGYDALMKIRLYYAESRYPNREWIKHPGNELNPYVNPEPVFGPQDSSSDIYFSDNDYDFSAAIIKEDNYISDKIRKTVYKMWYVKTNKDLKQEIKFAYSFSGNSWKTDNGPSVLRGGLQTFYKEGIMMPTVILDLWNNKMVYKMWFMGNDGKARQLGLAYATSEGSNFDLFKADPVMAQNSIPEDENGIADANVIRDGNIYKMWYIGAGADSNKYVVCYRESKEF